MTRSLKGLAALVSNIAVQRPARSRCSPAAADRARSPDGPRDSPLGCQWLSTLSYTSRERYGEIGS